MDQQHAAPIRAVIRVSNRNLLLCILALAFSLRVSAACVWQGRLDVENVVFRFGDSDSYWVIARNLSQGRFEYGGENAKIFRAPLYPIVLLPFAAAESAVERDGTIEESATSFTKRDAVPRGRLVFYARLLGCLLGTICVWGIVQMATDLHSKAAGLVAGALAAIYPGAIGMSIFILSESTFCPLMIASMFALHRVSRNFSSREPIWRYAVLGGLLSGLAILARPSWSLLGGMLAIYWLALWMFHRKTIPWRTICAQWLAFAFGIFIVMCPWWIRNYSITGKFVPTTLQVGASLYDGLHENATGSSDEGMAFSNVFVAEQRSEDASNTASGIPLESTLEWRVDRRLRNAAIEWAIENPSDAISLGLVKLAKTWRPFPVAQELGSSAIRYAEGMVYLAVMILGSMGAWSSRKELGSWLYLLPCFYFALIHMLFIGSVRYRQPAVLLMCVLAGIGVCWLMRCYQNRRSQRSDAKDGFITSNT